MSKKPEIIYERIATLNKILAIPDRRFKSGYRSHTTVASSSYLFFEGIDGATLTLNRVDKMGSQYENTEAVADITFKLQATSYRL